MLVVGGDGVVAVAVIVAVVVVAADAVVVIVVRAIAVVVVVVAAVDSGWSWCALSWRHCRNQPRKQCDTGFARPARAVIWHDRSSVALGCACAVHDFDYELAMVI